MRTNRSVRRVRYIAGQRFDGVGTLADQTMDLTDLDRSLPLLGPGGGHRRHRRRVESLAVAVTVALVLWIVSAAVAWMWVRG